MTQVYLKNWPLNRNLVVVVTVVNVAGMVGGCAWVIWVQFILSLVTVTVVECRLTRIASMPRKNYHVLRGYIAAVEWGVKYLFCCVYIICLLCCIYAKSTIYIVYLFGQHIKHPGFIESTCVAIGYSSAVNYCKRVELTLMQC